MSYGVALRNGVPFTLGTIAALCVNATSQAWSPSALWPTGTEAGMWIDPSNLTSQWQDSTGTTPISTPGTVADSSNPVGLALDLRLGAPETLGPELVTNGDFSDGTTGWTAGGVVVEGSISVVDGWMRVIKTAGSVWPNAHQTIAVTTGSKFYQITCDYRNPFNLTVFVSFSGTDVNLGTASSGSISRIVTAGSTEFQIGIRDNSGNVSDYIEYDNVSVREVPGNHLLQATSTARPLLSAYDGQTLGPGNTYDATGYPIFQLYDGVDDGMATASFAAGTLINGMDCMIALRRDSAAACVLFGTLAGFGYFESGGWGASMQGCGTPTALVDGVQVAGGTGVTGNELHSALTVGDWHIFEAQNLDLSSWTALAFSEFPGYQLNGARGDILLFPSTASTADKDKARQYLANKYGVTLP